MYAMQTEEPDFDSVLRRGLYPELVERAMTFARPVFNETGTAIFRDDASEERPPIATDKMCAALAEATGCKAEIVILLPDNSTLPNVRQMQRNGGLSPKRKLGDLLHRTYGGTVRSLSEEVRRGLRRHLDKVFHVNDEEVAHAGGFEYALRVARRDVLYHFLGVAVSGDARKARMLSGLVQWLQWVVPLAIVDESCGIWLSHRV